MLNSETLQTEIVRETSGHGLFSCRVHNDLAWIGCYDGHLFVFDINTFEKKDQKKLQQGIYDIMVFEDNRAGIKEEFLIFGQHFGHVDMIEAKTMKRVLQTKNLKVNTIFNLFRTSRLKDYELCFCGYNGIYFAKINRNLAKETFELVVSTTESFFVDRYVSRGMEYTADKFVVCIDQDEQFYLVDRVKKQSIAKVRWSSSPSSPCSSNFEIIKVPGFNTQKFPFLLMRDDFNIYIFNISTKRLYIIKSAYYGSANGYRTMDLINQPGNPTEFEAVYLETGEADAPTNATTTINRISFTQIFMNTLKQIANASQ